MTDCEPKLIPADPHVRLSKEMSPTTREGKAAMEKIPYMELVGCLNYLTHATRPDIAFAVNQISRYCQNPGPQHWAAAKHVLAYLKGTAQYGLCFGGSSGSSGSSHFGLTGWVDSDFAGDLDFCRSTSGYVFRFNNGPISWSSRRQTSTAKSTTQAEYQSASDGAREAVPLMWLLQELGVESKRPVTLFCDNNAAIQLANHPAYHPRTKHIRVDYHIIREYVEGGGKCRCFELTRKINLQTHSQNLFHPPTSRSFVISSAFTYWKNSSHENNL